MNARTILLGLGLISATSIAPNLTYAADAETVQFPEFVLSGALLSVEHEGSHQNSGNLSTTDGIRGQVTYFFDSRFGLDIAYNYFNDAREGSSDADIAWQTKSLVRGITVGSSAHFPLNDKVVVNVGAGLFFWKLEFDATIDYLSFSQSGSGSFDTKGRDFYFLGGVDFIFTERLSFSIDYARYRQKDIFSDISSNDGEVHLKQEVLSGGIKLRF